MNEKLKNLIKNRGTIGTIMLVVGSLLGYAGSEGGVSLPVLKVEVTNMPAACSCGATTPEPEVVEYELPPSPAPKEEVEYKDPNRVLD